MAERIGLHGVNYAIGFSAWLDITPEGVSKGSALELVRGNCARHAPPARASVPAAVATAQRARKSARGR